MEIPEDGRLFHDYLGDGAYVYLDPGCDVVLYTSNGIVEENHVVLGEHELANFEGWVARMREGVAKIREEQSELSKEGEKG